MRARFHDGAKLWVVDVELLAEDARKPIFELQWVNVVCFLSGFRNLPSNPEHILTEVAAEFNRAPGYSCGCSRLPQPEDTTDCSANTFSGLSDCAAHGVVAKLNIGA